MKSDSWNSSENSENNFSDDVVKRMSCGGKKMVYKEGSGDMKKEEKNPSLILIIKVITKINII